MASKEELTDAMIAIINKKGMAALKNARQTILLSYKDNSRLTRALRHFSNVTLKEALPVFPALITLSCEAVGGTPEKTVPFGEAIVLISGAADLHDDIIDGSLSKGSKQTVLGKFGLPIAILAGDALLAQGILQLSKESKHTQKEEGELIEGLLTDAIKEICLAEELELRLRERRLDMPPDQYLKVVWRKAVVPELAMKVGAILGGGSPSEVASLGGFGRTFGFVSAVIEEFADLFEPSELRGRLGNGCPPLPLTYALNVTESRDRLLPLLAADSLSKEAHEKIAETVLGSCKVKRLHKTLADAINSDLEKLRQSAEWKKQGEIEILLRALLCYLDKIFSD